MLARTNTLDAELLETYRQCIKFLEVQSEDIEDEDSGLKLGGSGETVSEILTFVDSSTGLIDDNGYSKNPIASASQSSNTSLERFLSRPTLIDSRTWTTSSSIGYLGSTIEPWYSFLSNSTISNKLKNYAFLRGKLCLKIVVNATPFHFGLMRIAYEPNCNAADTGSRHSMIRSNPVSDNAYIVPLSQLPGTWIYPAENAGGEIHVPFFRHASWLNINLAADVKTMGTLKYYIAAPLAVASASGSTSITIDTFAWLEDVELSGSTAELVLQAKDEYDGVISAPASAIAEVSRHLESVPIIGKFARATTIGANAIAQVASLFGFTNVPNISDVAGYVPSPAIHLATSQISTPIQKLTLDPKQEISLDPTLHGLSSEDELCIKKIVERESTLTMAGWNTADAIGTVIFNADVSPMLFVRVPINDSGGTLKSNRVYHTPLSYLGMLFQLWRGDIIFDIDVVCTKFHKGRLKIAWDPLGSGGSVALPENQVYTTILDIGESNKVSVRIPFHQAYEFLRCRGIQRDNWTAGNSLPSSNTADNGLLVISVLTPLVSPVSPQNVSVRISVRAADNLEYANPTSSLGESWSTTPPSFFDVQGKDIVDVVSQNISLGDNGSKHPHRYDLNVGERVVSLRTLLHRYSLYDYSTVAKQTSTRFSTYAKSYSRLPPMFGYDPAGLSTANKIKALTGTFNFNYTPTHPITLIAMMYGAFRGSVNYIANISSDLTPYIGDVYVQRLTDSALPTFKRGAYNINVVSGGTTSNALYYMNTGFGFNAYGTAGSCFTNTQTNGSINWSMPHMSYTNFSYCDPYYSIAGNSEDETNRECSVLSVRVVQQVANTTTETFAVTTHAATGPDFTCLWWLCCPTLDYYEIYPTAP